MRPSNAIRPFLLPMVALAGLLGAVTVGLDQRGFKWVQLEVSGEFDLFGTGAAS